MLKQKLKGGTIWSHPKLYVTLETFLVQFLGPTGTIWRPNKITDLRKAPTNLCVDVLFQSQSPVVSTMTGQ